MAGISSPGIGSGLDVNSLVSKLVAADRAPEANRLANQEASVKARLSALGTLKSALAKFQSTVKSLTENSAFQTRSAQSGDTDLFTASATSDAAAGTYSIEVDSLAQAQRLSSAAYASEDTVVGTGTLTISVGGKNLALNIDSTNNTLADIRDAINNATGNPGVTATIINVGDGSHLEINAKETGVENAATVTGTGGLTTFADNLTEIQAASDAQIKVDGYSYSSPTDVVDGVIQGVKLNLVKADSTAPTTLTIGLDEDAAKSAVHQFVDSYNSLVQTIDKLSSYNKDTGQAGALLGDSTLLRIQSQLTREIGSVVDVTGSPYRSLTEIGIEFQVDGSLAVKDDKLNAALSENFDAVGNLFSADNGYASELNSRLSGYLDAGGVFDTRTDGLNTQLQHINDSKAALNQRMAAVEKRYRAKFTALDQLISKMKHTDSYLTRQFAHMGIPGNDS